MKVYFTEIKQRKYFELMKYLLTNTLLDLGHVISEKDDADIIISMRDHPENIIIEKGQKFIFIQTEPYKINKKHDRDIAKYGDYPFRRYNADVYWGFDKYDKNESYLILGYHPCLDLIPQLEKINSIYPLGFVGGITPRRKDFFSGLTTQVKYCTGWIKKGNEWKIKEMMQMYRECKINIDVGAWDKTQTATPWDRITRFLHNKCFFMMETVYCPIEPVVVFDLPNAEETIQKYLNNDKLREDIAEECYVIYKRDFDMRNILEEKLKEL